MSSILSVTGRAAGAAEGFGCRQKSLLGRELGRQVPGQGQQAVLNALQSGHCGDQQVQNIIEPLWPQQPRSLTAFLAAVYFKPLQISGTFSK
jgi:hypothetical protein